MSEVPESANRHDLRIFRAFRRIVRAIDLHSRRLAQEHGVTGPQLVCLVTLVEEGPLANSALAANVSLSPSTVVGILDRLEQKGLVRRERSEQDRRVVRASASEAGRALVERAPSPLQERLARRLRRLPEKDQSLIAASLERIVHLMEAESVDASPFLETGPIDRPPDPPDRTG